MRVHIANVCNREHAQAYYDILCEEGATRLPGYLFFMNAHPYEDDVYIIWAEDGKPPPRGEGPDAA